MQGTKDNQVGQFTSKSAIGISLKALTNIGAPPYRCQHSRASRTSSTKKTYTREWLACSTGRNGQLAAGACTNQNCALRRVAQFWLVHASLYVASKSVTLRPCVHERSRLRAKPIHSSTVPPSHARTSSGTAVSPTAPSPQRCASTPCEQPQPVGLDRLSQ